MLKLRIITRALSRLNFTISNDITKINTPLNTLKYLTPLLRVDYNKEQPIIL